MDAQGYLIVFGSLTAIVSAVIVGRYLNNGWGVVLMIAGIVGGIVWLWAAMQLMRALNSDI